MKKNEMNAKKLLVSFLLIASVLLLATATVSAYDVSGDIADTLTVKVDGITVANEVDDAITTTASVIAGETVTVKVEFRADATTWEDDDENPITSLSDVRIRAELEGDKEDVVAITSLFDIEDDKTYVKYLTLKVPSDLDEDELSGDLTLNLKIWNSDFKTEVEDVILNVQKPSYDVAIKSVITSNSVDAGEKLPVEVVLKNVGYNDVDDLYVTVSIPELNIEKSAYFGDIVAVEDDNDDDDSNTARGTIYLDVPYNAKGDYTLVVSAENDEVDNTYEKQITIKNSISDIAIKSGNDLILLNPTSKLVVYTVKYLSNENVVIIPAESSKNVAIEVPSGDYDFDVAVYSGDSVVDTVNFSGSSQESQIQLTNPVFVLTVILAIVFLVLLVVLVVLITKKPQKTEEFGESYY